MSGTKGSASAVKTKKKTTKKKSTRKRGASPATTLPPEDVEAADRIQARAKAEAPTLPLPSPHDKSQSQSPIPSQPPSQTPNPNPSQSQSPPPSQSQSQSPPKPRGRGRPKKPRPPEITAADCRTGWEVFDVAIAQRLGLDPLKKHELDTLAKATEPVAQKYAHWLIEQPEVVLLVTVGVIYGPKSYTIYAKKKAAKKKEDKVVKAARVEGAPDPRAKMGP